MAQEEVPYYQAARFKNQRAAGKLLLSYAIGLNMLSCHTNHFFCRTPVLQCSR
jgi:hypothetical protein